MRRTFLAKRNVLLTSGSASWGAGFIVLVLLAVFVRFAAPDSFWGALAPVFSMGNALSAHVGSAFDSFKNPAALAKENQKLQSENQALSVENGTLAAKVSDLEILLGKSPAESPGITAGVLARPPVSAYGTLLVAAGSIDGVTKGMEVFGESGIPLGFVSDLSARFARVTLFSAPGVETQGWGGEKRIPVTLVGEGGGSFIASMPRDAGLGEGDLVYVPGPGAVPVGAVAQVRGAASDPFATLVIQPAANPFAISEVVLRDEGASVLQAVMMATSTTP